MDGDSDVHLSVIDQIRIGVALFALRHKPQDQSFSSYVLDLQDMFPVCKWLISRDNNPWRTRALEIEREYQKLKDKYEHDRLRARIDSEITTTVPDSGSERASCGGPIKKKKKSPLNHTFAKQLDIEDYESIFAVFEASNLICRTIDDNLWSQDRIKVDPDFRLAVVNESFRVLAAGLDQIIACPGPSVAQQNQLRSLNIVLHHILTTVWTMSRTASIATQSPTHELLAGSMENILSQLSLLIMQPVIKSFAVLSESYIYRCFRPRAEPLSSKDLRLHKPAENSRVNSNSVPRTSLPCDIVDIRKDLLNFFRRVVVSVHSEFRAAQNPIRASSLFQACLILDTTREIERMLFRSGDGSSAKPRASALGVNANPTEWHPSGRTLPSRLHKLAVKDALWYLCAVIHSLFDDPPLVHGAKSFCGQRVGGDGRLLWESISTTLLKVLTKCKRMDHNLERARKNFERGLLMPGRLATPRDQQDNSSPRGVRNATLQADAYNDEAPQVNFAHVNVAPNIGGTLRTGRVPQEANPAGEFMTLPHETAQEQTDDELIELDEVGYDLLLGIAERYWTWTSIFA